VAGHDGPLTGELRNRIRVLGIEDNVSFLDQINHVYEVLRWSRIFLLTMQTEGLSIALIESLAAGVPVLAPNVGDLGEVLIHEKNGLFIRPDNASEVADIIDGLLDNPDKLELVSALAVQHILQTNSAEAIQRH
jgi:L-malate glycosyltransferase